MFKNNKKKKEIKRYWDFSYIQKFIERNREHIENLTLQMENDKEIREVLIKNGNTIKSISGHYQFLKTPVDGVLYSSVDHPCMLVQWKGGYEELLRCYVDITRTEPVSEARKRVYSKRQENINVDALVKEISNLANKLLESKNLKERKMAEEILKIIIV